MQKPGYYNSLVRNARQTRVYTNLCGLIIIIAASFFLASRNEYHYFTGESGIAVAVALICVGVFIFLTGFFGCCGAMRENYCMLFTYAVIIFCLLLVQIAAGITGFVLRHEISDEIDKSMKNELMHYKNDTAVHEAYDDIQKGLKCCGASNYTDWFAPNILYGNHSVPESCCIEENCDHYNIPDTTAGAKKIIHTEAPSWLKAFRSPEDKTLSHLQKRDQRYRYGATADVWRSYYMIDSSQGCASEVKNILHDNMMAIIIACIVIGLIEITGIFCSCCLMKSVKNEYEVV
ncbi:CD63 antigen [Holothuria leucospilota]|uniref:Tetraspanin n=1 Tax=Holothuria leucospilota TaxID=206669 RepID=A0A9Q1BCY1_HOLLE|nr:CD63 antigen [Holothuria leucospilota]